MVKDWASERGRVRDRAVVGGARRAIDKSEAIARLLRNWRFYWALMEWPRPAVNVADVGGRGVAAVTAVAAAVVPAEAAAEPGVSWG